jgi:hypothetical protein
MGCSMTYVSISAEGLAASNFVFANHSPELRAVRIIKEMNLRIFRDQGGVLASIAGRDVKVVSQGAVHSGLPLEILLNGVIIYMDPDLKAEYNLKLQNRDLRWDREF